MLRYYEVSQYSWKSSYNFLLLRAFRPMELWRSDYYLMSWKIQFNLALSGFRIQTIPCIQLCKLNIDISEINNLDMSFNLYFRMILPQEWVRRYENNNLTRRTQNLTKLCTFSWHILYVNSVVSLIYCSTHWYLGEYISKFTRSKNGIMGIGQF